MASYIRSARRARPYDPYARFQRQDYEAARDAMAIPLEMPLPGPPRPVNPYDRPISASQTPLVEPKAPPPIPASGQGVSLGWQSYRKIRGTEAPLKPDEINYYRTTFSAELAAMQGLLQQRQPNGAAAVAIAEDIRSKYPRFAQSPEYRQLQILQQAQGLPQTPFQVFQDKLAKTKQYQIDLDAARRAGRWEDKQRTGKAYIVYVDLDYIYPEELRKSDPSVQVAYQKASQIKELVGKADQDYAVLADILQKRYLDPYLQKAAGYWAEKGRQEALGVRREGMAQQRELAEEKIRATREAAQAKLETRTALMTQADQMRQIATSFEKSNPELSRRLKIKAELLAAQAISEPEHTQAGANIPPAPATEAEFLALPSGTQRLDSQGRIITRP